MRFTFTTLLAVAASVLTVQAQTLVSTWSYDGGGLDPATYSGTYRPAALVADAGSTGGGTISVANMTTGGLGSSNYPTGYGGYYTFFSNDPIFTLQTSTVLSGVDTITISFLAGEGSPAFEYDNSSITLNYNDANPAVASSDFEATPGFIIDSPLGPQNLILYTWTFTDLSDLGGSTGFSTSWGVGEDAHHVFYGEFTVTQAVPEPSAVCLLALGGAVVAFRRKPRRSLQ